MAFNFRIFIVIRILTIVSFITALLLALLKTDWLVVPLIISLLTIGLVIELIFFVEKTNREFANFLLAIKHSDFSKYNEVDKRGRSFKFLKSAQNTIINKFQSIRIDNESHYFFYKE